MVDDAARLELCTFKLACRFQLYGNADPKGTAQSGRDFLLHLSQSRRVRLAPDVNVGKYLGLDCEPVELSALPFQQQPELATKDIHAAQNVFDSRRENVLAANDDHVVGTAVNASSQCRVSSTAGTVDHIPLSDVARPITDHRLRRPFGMRIHRNAFGAHWE